MKIEVKLKNHPEANSLGLLTFCPFFTVFLGKMDQKWAGSKFFGFLWIWVNVLDDPLKEKKMFPQKCGEEDNFPVLGGLPLKSPPETPGGPEGGIFSLIPIWGHRPSKISR